MDVALDSNIILNDPGMRGNAFQSLLDYLRKTGSRMVVSKVVLDEVVSRYRDRLLPAIRKATVSAKALNELALEGRAELPEIDVEREAQALKLKLLKPAGNVQSSQLVNNFSDVRIEEVVRRGVERIPPANNNGEELRDVVHWLMILAYASASKKELAFITNDEHFQKEGALHPRLQQDTLERNAKVCFYSSLDAFIKDRAPNPQTLSEDEAFTLLGRATVSDRFEIEMRRFFPRQWPQATAFEVSNRHVEFVKGSLYDVGADSRFGELEFEGALGVRVTVVTPQFGNTTFVNLLEPSYQPMSNVAYYVPGGSNVSLAPQVQANVIGSASPFPGSTSFDNSLETTTNYVPFANAGVTYFPSANWTPSLNEDVSEYEVAGNAVLTIRIVSGKVLKIETERVELVRVEKKMA